MAKEKPGPQRTRGGAWGHPHLGHTDGKAGVLSSISVLTEQEGGGGVRVGWGGRVEVKLRF